MPLRPPPVDLAVAALIVPGIPGELGEVWERNLATAPTVLAIRHVRSLRLGILVGMAAFWLLRAIG